MKDLIIIDEALNTNISKVSLSEVNTGQKQKLIEQKFPLMKQNQSDEMKSDELKEKSNLPGKIEVTNKNLKKKSQRANLNDLSQNQIIINNGIYLKKQDSRQIKCIATNNSHVTPDKKIPKKRGQRKKSQNCVKAAIAFVCKNTK